MVEGKGEGRAGHEHGIRFAGSVENHGMSSNRKAGSGGFGHGSSRFRKAFLLFPFFFPLLLFTDTLVGWLDRFPSIPGTRLLNLSSPSV
jgi:hypothetical protein